MLRELGEKIRVGLADRVGLQTRVLKSETTIGDDVEVIWSHQPVWIVE
jgi:hypothetical protein